MIKGFDRKNLNYITERTNKKLDRIVEILKDTAVGSTIIYCGSRKKTEDIYGGLRDNKFDAVCYHAGMSNAERKQNQELFINGTKKIIVATNAFGMGIDKADVRNVIHTGYTSSVESYYQEAGRAGRDGLPSNCYLLYNYGDNKLQEFFINSAYPEKDEIAEVYHYLFIHKKTQLSLTAITISNAIGMSEYKVTNILGLLERLNIISINKNRTSPKIKFCYRREDLIFFLSNMNEANRIVLDSLLRSFTDDAYSRYVEIDFDTFSEKFGIRTEKISIALRNLTKSSIIEYQEEMPANTLVLLDTEKEIDNIGLDFNKLMHLKNNASDRLDIMIQFAQTDYCKRNFILDYFNDKSYLGKCGRCSSCKKTKQKSNIEFSDNDMQKVLAATLELGEHFGRVLLSHYLAGSKKDRGNKIKEYNLDKGKHFGALKEHSNNAILDIIDSLIQKNILEKSDGTYPIISVSNMGKKLLNHKVNPLPYSRNVMPIFDASTTKEKQSKTIVKPRIIKNISKTNIINNANIINTTSNAKALSLIIDKYFQEGLKIEEIASILQITNGKIGEIIQSSIEQEIITNPNNYINKSILDRVINILWDKPGILLRDLQLQLKIPINFALLRIVAAFAKKDIENAKKFGK
jgi:ATP-dependent DNA helicase RecQ